jgi:hypothetical protein
LGFGQYEAAFREKDVDAKLLRDLTADGLKEIVISSSGHRRRLLNAIAKLRDDRSPSLMPSSGDQLSIAEHERGSRAGKSCS